MRRATLPQAADGQDAAERYSRRVQSERNRGKPSYNSSVVGMIVSSMTSSAKGNNSDML